MIVNSVVKALSVVQVIDNMENIIFVGDLHLSSKTPSYRIDDYGVTILNKLESLLNLAIKSKANTIVFTGDFFESYYEPISYMNKVLEVLAKFRDKNIKILSLIGNHDLPYNNMEYANSTPLSLLFKSKLVDKLDYVTDDSVEIFGLHFSEATKLTNIVVSPEKTSILVMHYAFNNTVPGESISEKELSTFDIVVSGHDHMFYEPYLVDKDGPVVLRPGSFTRRTKDSYNTTRDDIIVYCYEKASASIKSLKLPGVAKAIDVFSDEAFKEGSINLYSSSLSSIFNSTTNNIDNDKALISIFDIIESLEIPVTKASKKTVISFLASKGIFKK